MTPGLRKLALLAHITFSVGWIGAVAGFLALAIAGLTSQNVETVRAVYPAMELIARFVIVPLALASLLSGIIQSLSTSWGLFRHYWVVAKLLLTVFATFVLLKKLPLIGYAAQRAAEMPSPSAALRSIGFPLLIHAGGGILVLLAITALSVYKPWGLTLYGRRKQQERRYQPLRTPKTAGVQAICSPENGPAGDSLPQGLNAYLATGIGLFIVAIHVSMHLANHIFHHGH
jgi:hypothetical protein